MGDSASNAGIHTLKTKKQHSRTACGKQRAGSGTAAGADNNGDVPEQGGGDGGHRRDPHGITPDGFADAAKPTQVCFMFCAPGLS
jgi:hypothetical protein